MSFLLCFELEMPLEGSLVKVTGNSGFQLDSSFQNIYSQDSSPTFEVKSNSHCLYERLVIR